MDKQKHLIRNRRYTRGLKFKNDLHWAWKLYEADDFLGGCALPDISDSGGTFDEGVGVGEKIPPFASNGLNIYVSFFSRKSLPEF
ncbi:hypothetical protein CEXT_479591 [Caerostris extrusa]|uniref:Uncharacterized protein n=1 Tax=Caerostris extrusa TaxID=172846 RepID=A0AAV4MNQ2_CAEEX|nr:hypothetical protein CEXT_479591 [Caerostris extrusa]